MAKNGTIVCYTADEINAMRARGESHTERVRAAAMTPVQPGCRTLVVKARRVQDRRA